MKRRTRRGKKKSDKGKKLVCARRDRMSELIKEMAERRDPLLPQMLMAFIIGFVLCPQASMSCPLFAFRYAEKLDTLKEYNWVELVYNVLRTEMNKAKKTITKRFEGNRSRGGYMGGFASVFLIWFYEFVGILSLRVGAESLSSILSFYKCPRSLRKYVVQDLVRDTNNFRKHNNDLMALKFEKRIAKAATATTSTATESALTKFKRKVITKADLDQLIHEKKWN